MKMKASKFVGVHVIHSLSLSDKLLIKYNFCIPPTTWQRWLALRLPLDIHLGHKKNIIK
jgi:hypothetical protein